jgi:hypothetical protein
MKRHGHRAREDRHLQRQRQRDAQDRGMGGRVTEIGHAAPHDETAQRRGGERHADPGQRGARHEIVQHHSAASWS